MDIILLTFVHRIMLFIIAYSEFSFENLVFLFATLCTDLIPCTIILLTRHIVRHKYYDFVTLGLTALIYLLNLRFYEYTGMHIKFSYAGALDSSIDTITALRIIFGSYYVAAYCICIAIAATLKATTRLAPYSHLRIAVLILTPILANNTSMFLHRQSFGDRVFDRSAITSLFKQVLTISETKNTDYNDSKFNILPNEFQAKTRFSQNSKTPLWQASVLEAGPQNPHFKIKQGIKNYIQSLKSRHGSVNVVYVIQESLAAKYFGILNNNANSSFTPHLDDIFKNHGIIFPNTFHNGPITQFGQLATQCGIDGILEKL